MKTKTEIIKWEPENNIMFIRRGIGEHPTECLEIIRSVGVTNQCIVIMSSFQYGTWRQIYHDKLNYIGISPPL